MSRGNTCGGQLGTINDQNTPRAPSRPQGRDLDALTFLRAGIPWLLGILTLSGLLMVAVNRDAVFHTWDLARHADRAWLMLAALAQAGTYVCAALVWWVVLRRAGLQFHLRGLIPLGVAKLFTDQTLPSGGISGNILVLAGLTRRGVPPNIVMAVLLVGMISFYAAYLVAAVIAGTVLWLNRLASTIIITIVLVFAVLAVLLPLLAFWARDLLQERVPATLARLPGVALLLRAVAEAPDHLLHDATLLMQTTLLQLSVFVLDALTLWLVLHAIGTPQPAWVVFSATVLASIIATIGPIPLGLGTFEAGCIAMLSLAGLPLEASTLLLRGLTFWLPMLPGLWLARRELRLRADPNPMPIDPTA